MLGNRKDDYYMEEIGKSQHDKWKKDPANWKLGIFYFNKEDARIFPPKRPFYGGWTVNFANPYSIIVNLGIVAIILATVYFVAIKQTRFKSHRFDRGGMKVEAPI